MNNSVRLAPAAAREFTKLPDRTREQVRRALTALASGKQSRQVESIRGAGDEFQRLRVGDYRVMLDVIDSDRVILVLGVVHRRDLERWIRNR